MRVAQLKIDSGFDKVPTSALLIEIHHRMKEDTMGQLDSESKNILFEIADTWRDKEIEVPQFTPDTLPETMKLEWLQENFDKITLEQLESLVK